MHITAHHESPMYHHSMNSKQESFMSSAAAILLLFTTMLNPLVSVSLAIVLLVVFAIYKYRQSK